MKNSILLVEDDPFISELYSAKFSNTGYDIKLARNGEEALTILLEYEPGIILLDLVMPEMDGFEFLRHVKKDKKLADIPVVVLTNLGDRQNIEKAMSLGANSYIIKSHLTPAEVINKVEVVLNTHNS